MGLLVVMACRLGHDVLVALWWLDWLQFGGGSGLDARGSCGGLFGLGFGGGYGLDECGSCGSLIGLGFGGGSGLDDWHGSSKVLWWQCGLWWWLGVGSQWAWLAS